MKFNKTKLFVFQRVNEMKGSIDHQTKANTKGHDGGNIQTKTHEMQNKQSRKGWKDIDQIKYEKDWKTFEINSREQADD